MHPSFTTVFRFRYLAASLALCATGLTIDVCAHGDLHERISVLSEKIAATPDSPGLHFELASVYCQHGEWAKSLVEIERTEELAPEKFPTGLLRGQAAFGFGRLDEAKGCFDSFLEKTPGYSQALLYRARVLMKMARFDEALVDYRESLRTHESPNPDFVSEVTDVLVGHKQEDEALRILDNAIARLGPVPSLETRALELDLAAGRFDSALTRTEILQKNAVRPESWMARRAAIQQQAGRDQEARATWEELISRIEKLPNLQRGSRAFQRLEADARQALSALPSATQAAPVVTSTSAANSR
ncbi:MAG: hypothetical protein QM760_20405 [Nibricoccus sp.]